MPHSIHSIFISSPALSIMRDRRNTNLSTSSTSSCDAPISSSPPTCPVEKPICSSSVDDASLVFEKEVRTTRLLRSHIIYRIASLFCITTFIIAHTVLPSSIFQRNTLTVFGQEGQTRNHPVGSTSPERIDFVDARGQPRWTASIPTDAAFPLHPKHYAELCSSRHDEPTSRLFSMTKLRHTHQKPLSTATFMDVQDAQSAGVLSTQGNASARICSSSLTFAIDPAEASFGKTLLLLWLSYGIAITERRAFFVDDTHWVYGKLTSFFPPLPDPDCVRPPSSHITPCPLHAKHVLISTATARWSLHPRLDALSRSWSRPFDSSRKIFDLLRLGYQALFHIIGEDKSYAANQVSLLRLQASSQQQPFVAMHIRRGDLHPLELQFSQDYLPLEKYTSAAKSMLLASSSSTGDPFVVLASDDPDLIDTKELALAAAPLDLQKAQDRIQLATKAALDRDSPAKPIRQPGSAYVKHVDENTGWDGGFYAPLFFSLGRTDAARTQARSLEHQVLQQPSDHTMRMRELVARSYLLDLEILSHADGVVCAVSSAACRVLGVMMGWDAVQAGRWINVDDGRPWSWDGSR